MSFSFSFGGNTSSSTSSSSAPVFSFGDAPSTSGFSFGDASSKPFSFTGDAADTTNKPFAFTGDAAESTTTSSFAFATPSTSSTSTSTPAFSFSTPSEPVKATPSFSFSTPITESTSSSSFAFGATPSTSSFGFGASDTTSATSTSFAFGTTPAPATTSSTSSFNFGATTSDKDTTSSFAFGTSDTTPKTSFGDTTSTSSFGFGASKPSTSTSTSKSTFGSDTTSKSNTGFSSSFAPAPSTSTSTGFGTSTSFGTTSDSSSFGAGFGASSTSTSTSTGFGTSFGAPDTSTSTFTSFGDAKQAAATSTKPATKTTFTSTSAPTTSTLSYTPAPAPSTSTSLIPVDTPLETDDTVASLPIPLPRGAGVNVTWGQGHELLLYGRTRGKVGTGGSSLDPTASTVHTFSWEFYFGQTRTLLNSWHAIFVNIQTQATSTSSPTWLDTLLASSKHYRAELETFILQAALSIDSQEVNDILQRYNIEKEEYISTLRLLEAAKSVFHLCEIMFVDPHDNITAQLVDWLQRCVPLPEAMNHADIDSEEYWDAMYRLTIQGRTLEALTLLEKNTTLQHTHPSLFHHLIDLYHRIPSLTIREGNLQTFVTAFHAWRNECEQWKNDPSVISNPSIERLFSIFIGEPDTLAEIADSWYELMVAHLLYIRPHMSRDETSLLVETCLSQMLEIDPEMNMTALDDVRKAILQGDATRALHLCNHIIDIRWFMAHLTDLIKHAGQLPPVILESGCDYREYLLLEYAATAMYTSSLWQLAPAYLSECTVHGTAYLRSLIAHQPLTSDRIAYKLIALCDRYELSTERRLIQHTMGMHAIRQQRYGSAIHWFIQGRWIERISGLCHMLLDQYMEDGTYSLAAIDSVVDNVTDISISPDLAFLTKFRDLCLLQQSLLELSHIPITSDIEQQQYHMWREAIEICVRVMITGVAPRRYWAYLLQAITPALEKTASAPILSVSDTYSLLACLEELSRSHLSSLYLSKLSTSDVSVIRLALTRNLARAIQMEESN